MRVAQLLPLAAALTTAIVIPDERVMNNVQIESSSTHGKLSEWKDKFTDALDNARSAIDDAIESAYDGSREAVDRFTDYAEGEYEDAESWLREFKESRKHDLESAVDRLDEVASKEVLYELKKSSKAWKKDLGLPTECPHKKQAHQEDEEGDDHHHHPKKPPHPPKKPHHPPHHKKPTHTVYELIKKSKYTTKLAALVDKYPDVVQKLNGSESNFTLFAPTDRAFEKIPKHVHPSKEFLLRVLQYHVVPDVYPAGRVLKSRTLPTVLQGKGLSDEPKKTPQRLTVNLGLRGLTVDFFARIVAVNIFGTNGVVHGIDSLLVPPPKAATIVQTFPGTFSTLELGLWKTGLIFALNDTSNHLGGTLFAPSNGAFERLGPKANAFLFSRYGKKYLKALLEYHVVPNITLYSDALYVASKHGKEDLHEERTFHIDLPTLLKGKSLSVDVARWARFIDIRINGFYHVSVSDAPVYDGVIHLLGAVLIPPKTPGGRSEALTGEVDVEELKERLAHLVSEDDDNDDDYEELKVQKPATGFSDEMIYEL